MDEHDTKLTLLSIQNNNTESKTFVCRPSNTFSALLHVLTAETYTFVVTYVDVSKIIKKC